VRAQEQADPGVTVEASRETGDAGDEIAVSELDGEAESSESIIENADIDITVRVETEAGEPPDAVESVEDAVEVIRERVRIPEVIQVGGDGVVERDQETSDLVVVFGEGRMLGKVRHDMVVVLGQAYVDGPVGGDLVAPFTRLELGPNARIDGDMVIVGGSLEADPEAEVDGQRVEITWEKLRDIPGVAVLEEFFSGFKAWFSQGLLLGRLLPHQWGWWWWVAIGTAATYFFLALVAPRPVAAGTAELESQPVAAFFIGILGYVLVNVLFLILAATGVGVLVMPFFVVGLFIIQLVGKASVYQLVGYRIGSQWGGGSLSQPLPALLAGLAVFTLIYMIPVLGLMVWLISAPLGFGAALMALFRALRSESSPPPPTVRTAMVTTSAAPAALAERSASVSNDAPMAGPPPVIEEGQTPVVGAEEMSSLPRAGFWIRTAATALDLLVVLMPLAVLDLAEYFLIPWVVYHVVLWAWRGTTVGGVVCRLKIVRSDGQPLNFAVALVRSLASVLSAFALCLGFFWAGWTRERLAWHDMIAGTAIVKVPQGTPLI
jgi:uncharacterized RDD family membrane protein YckC